MTRREWLIAFVVMVVAISLTLIPYALGYELAPPSTEFTGLIMNPEDSESYLAKMQQGYMGAWLYTIPFTTEEHAPAFLGGFYMLLGHLARGLSLSVTQVWHLARMVSALILFLVTFAFIKVFVKDTYTRWLAYLLAVTGSGLGWLLFLFGQNYWLGDFPVDFKMPEAHLFFTALTFPHFAIGTALILGSVLLSWRAFETEQFRFAIDAGVVNLALAIVYPFLIYLCAAILALWWLHRWVTTRRLPVRVGLLTSIALAIPAPLLLYYYFVLKTNAVFRMWDAQSVTLSPHPLHYVVAYGVMLLFAAPTLRQREWRALWLWVLAVALLVYAPLNPQRRFVEGVQVPLAILAACGLTTYYLPRLRAATLFQKLAVRPNYSAAGLERLLVVGLLVSLALSNLYVLASTSVTMVLQQPYPLFRTEAEVRAVDWVGANLPRGAVVLSAYETGAFIPTRTNLRTVVGHWAETVNFEYKRDAVESFFNSVTADGWRSEFLAAQNVDYVFYGPRERVLGAYDPTRATNLAQIYTREGVVLYKVAK